MIVNILLSLLGATIANWVYAEVCYNKYYIEKPHMAYIVSILAAALSTAGWVFLIRSVKNQKDVFVTNLAWDIMATILCVSFPIFLYNVKLDFKTALGCSLAVAGIVIAKV